MSSTRRVARRGTRRVPDWLPSLVNAGRAFVAIGIVELFWIVTEWPNGAFAITFAAIVARTFEHHPFFRDAKATIWERISSGFAPSASDVAMRRIISACL
jgi:uncharacterized membrane protein YccC